MNDASTPFLLFHSVETMAFSEFSVQKNVLSVAMSSVATGSTALNVLRMGYIDAWNGANTLCSTTNTENYPFITMQLKAQTVISKIVLIPPICYTSFNQEVDVFLPQSTLITSLTVMAPLGTKSELSTKRRPLS